MRGIFLLPAGLLKDKEDTEMKAYKKTENDLSGLYHNLYFNRVAIWILKSVQNELSNDNNTA